MARSITLSAGLLLLLAAGVAMADGLDAKYGRDYPTIIVDGKPFKVLGRGKLAPGKSWTIERVVFKHNAVAIAAGVGVGDGSNLDLNVTVVSSGATIGNDVQPDNVSIVRWKIGAGKRNIVNMRLHNGGKGPCDFVLLANW